MLDPYPASLGELVASLRLLAAREPHTNDDLRALERECMSLALNTQRSSLCNRVPEIVWHFLSDADIRFRDVEYARVQTASLLAALAGMEQRGEA